jgi:hypothetical protein
MVKGYRDPDEKREIVKDYIKNNSTCIYKNIKEDTKINIERIYPGMKEVYMDAGVSLSKSLRKRDRKQIVMK